VQLLKACCKLIVTGATSALAAACAAGAPPQPVATAVPTSVPTSPPQPTALPTLSATETPVPRPSPTAVVAPIATQTAVPRPNATAAPVARGPTSQPRQPGPASETANLAARFESAINAGDVEGVLALFDPDAEVKVPPDRYVGLTQIRNWLSYLAENHFAIEPGFRSVVGERATWPAEVRSDYLVRIGLPSLLGTASLTMQDGLIHNYTFVLTEDSAHRHRAAQLAATEVLQDPVIVGQDAANVYGFNDVFRDASGRLVSYRDVLTAEPGSGPFNDLGGEPIVIRSGI
jgi:hypothetical protein